MNNDNKLLVNKMIMKLKLEMKKWIKNEAVLEENYFLLSSLILAALPLRSLR